MKSSYVKLLGSLTCPYCGGELHVISPPVVVFRGEDGSEIPGEAECLQCGEMLHFTHAFECPECGFETSTPENKCPCCGSEMEMNVIWE